LPFNAGEFCRPLSLVDFQSFAQAVRYLLDNKTKVNRSRPLAPVREMALKGTVIAVMLHIKIKI